MKNNGSLAAPVIRLLICSAHFGEVMTSLAPQSFDIGDLVRRQIAADRGVIKSRALRRPADFHEGETVLHQQRDVVAGLQPQCAEQLRTLVREFHQARDS
jgi:hypothetical protein